MIPILFNENETDFTTNGIGRLSDAISCSVHEAINGVYELKLEYPIDGKYFSDISEHKIIYSVNDETGIPQPFEIYRVERPINGIVTVYANHISYRLNKMTVLPFTASGVQAALISLKSNIAVQVPFTFSTDKSTQANMKVDQPVAVRSLMGGMEGSFIDTYKGEWEFNGFQCILKNRRGEDTDISIRYGKNLTDLKKTSDSTDIWTGVIPYWHGSSLDGETEESVIYNGIIYSSYHQDFPYDMVIPFDTSDHFQDKPTQAQLQSYGQSYVDANAESAIPVSIDISFIQLWQTEEYKNVAPLQRLHIGDTVNVYYERLGVNNSARIVEYQYNVLNDRYDSMTIGEVRASLAQAVTADIKEATKNAPTKTFMEQAIATATNLIAGGLGGYIVINRNADGEPNELLLMNTPNKETATRVIRMNYEGIAFGTGYNGPFNSAWVSIDGTFDASNINVTNLNAGSINVGILKDQQNSNYWNLATGEFRLSSSTTVGGKTVGEIAGDAQAAAEATAAAQLASAVADLQDQIDGNITTWYYNYVPTLSNAPANTWQTTDEKNNHIGDLFYNSSTGYAYRFMLDGSTYKWIRISDEDISAALQAAQGAQDTADNKRRVFVATPTPPYDIGDLWVQGSTGDIKRCKTAKTSAQTYAAADWILASKYTDDTAVTTLDNALNQQGVFNRLTNNGTAQGIFLENGNLYVNASYIRADYISAISSNIGTMTAGILTSNDWDYDYDTPGTIYPRAGMRISLTDKYIRTPNFAVINGNLYARNGTFSGSVAASSGTIGGYNISSTANTGTTANGGHVYTNSLYTHSSDSTYEYESGLAGGGAYNNATFYVRRIESGDSWSNSSYMFYVRNDGYMYANNVNIKGTITADGGTIGGWTISKNWQLSYTHSETSGSKTTQYQVGIRATGGYNASTDTTTAPTGNTAAFFVQSRENSGSGYGSWKTVFRINHDGSLIASNVTLNGGTISSTREFYGTSSWDLEQCTLQVLNSGGAGVGLVHGYVRFYKNGDGYSNTIVSIYTTNLSSHPEMELTGHSDGFVITKGSLSSASTQKLIVINTGLNPDDYEEDVIIYGKERITGAFTVGGTVSVVGTSLKLGADTTGEATISCHSGSGGYLRIANGLTVGSGATVSGYVMRVHGSLYVNDTMSASTVTQRSDETQKNIVQWDDRLDELIDRIEPIYFRWKDSEDKRLHVGVGARKTESILKELGLDGTGIVTVDGAGYAVNYIELSMILLHKYQQLKKELECLKKKVV